MRVTSVALAGLLSFEAGWGREQDGTIAAPIKQPTQTTPPAQTDQPPTTGQPPATSRPGTGDKPKPISPPKPTGQHAPDGHTYKPPTSVVNTPKAHPPETGMGRLPAEPRGGGVSAGGIVGAAAAASSIVGFGLWLHARNKPQAKLSRDGPKIPDQFSMSGFTIAAFCQANWPVVVDHVLTNGGELTIMVQTEGYAPFRYRIPATGARRQEIFRLPANFPATPTPGMYTISATTVGPGVATPVTMRLYGLGGGERAVGSVAIDQLRFGPDTIRPKQKQEANYAFHAHTEFDRVRAEFMKVVTAQGQIVPNLEDHDDINGVQRETTSSRLWNAKKRLRENTFCKCAHGNPCWPRRIG